MGQSIIERAARSFFDEEEKESILAEQTAAVRRLEESGVLEVLAEVGASIPGADIYFPTLPEEFHPIYEPHTGLVWDVQEKPGGTWGYLRRDNTIESGRDVIKTWKEVRVESPIDESGVRLQAVLVRETTAISPL